MFEAEEKPSRRKRANSPTSIITHEREKKQKECKIKNVKCKNEGWLTPEFFILNFAFFIWFDTIATCALYC